MSESTPGKGLPAPEVKTTTVRIYRDEVDKPPMFVLVDGRAYRAEDEQEELKYFLESEDIRAELDPMLTDRARDLLVDLVRAIENVDMAERETLETKIIEVLPAHEKAIRHVFHPDCEEYQLSSAEYVQHHFCKLAVPARQEGD